jgi:hypothetical protein
MGEIGKDEEEREERGGRMNRSCWRKFTETKAVVHMVCV